MLYIMQLLLNSVRLAKSVRRSQLLFDEKSKLKNVKKINNYVMACFVLLIHTHTKFILTVLFNVHGENSQFH